MSLTNHFEEAENHRIRRHRPQLNVNFNPAAWARAPILDVTGPYAYALNMPQIGECKPGMLFNKPSTDDYPGLAASRIPESTNDLERRLQSDGLIFLGKMQPTEGHALAFLLKPAGSAGGRSEMLYLRRDSNDLWSYREITEKGGCRRPYAPRQVDFSGRPIRSVLKAEFGGFCDFLGFASIPHDGILYYRRIILPDIDMRPFFRAVPAEEKLRGALPSKSL